MRATGHWQAWTMRVRRLCWTLGLWIPLCLPPALAAPTDNLVANPGFEARTAEGFFADWAMGEFGKVGKTLFADSAQVHAGTSAVRLVGTLNSFTTCAAKSIPVKPDTTYWVTWWFRAEQPGSSRSYLFLQTNEGQRVFPQTDRRGSFDWCFRMASYRTTPGETWFHPVLTMHTVGEPVGTSWWDDIAVYEQLPPDLETLYRRDHPWDDGTDTTAPACFARTPTCVVWGNRPEVRIYPQDPAPATTATAEALELVAPGNGHDLFQLVVTPLRDLPPVTVRLSTPYGPAPMPASSLTCRVTRCVPVMEVSDKRFPLGPTPDPLVDAGEAVPVKPGAESAIFWIEWAPPAGTGACVYPATATVLAGNEVLATVRLRLRAWGFDLPEVPRYRSMVMVSESFIRRFYPGSTEEQNLRRAWDILSAHRLSGFNVAVSPAPSLKDGQLQLDWARFDRILAAVRQYRATAFTLGPMFGGGCGYGWTPGKLAGLTALAEPQFGPVYAEFNRQVAARVKAAGLLDKAYVYPYDEPEPDYYDKIVGLCDLIHQGAPDLKCLMTVTPEGAEPLWGKVNAWIIPSSGLNAEVVARRRAAGDEIWIYNMVAAIEETGLAHRAYMWRALRLDAAGGLLWNSCWWNQINPWENPTSAPVPVGRDRQQLYRYQAGQASLFYPDPAGKGPLVPALRLLLIRQGVEDFDMVTELAAAWRGLAPRSAQGVDVDGLAAEGRAALTAPVMLDLSTPTRSIARLETVRRIVGAELEAAKRAPAVIAFPTRSDGQLVVKGCTEPGADLALNDVPVAVGKDGRFERAVTPAQLAAGLKWRAAKGTARKQWEWGGLQ